jgi:cell division protein FtsI (penicillin-binding protein 3)
VYAVNYQPVLKEKNINDSLMPDLHGMGLKDVIYLLENMGLKVQVKGKGKVLMQSVQAGTVLTKGMLVHVMLG